MAELSAAQRKKIPKSEYGLPARSRSGFASAKAGEPGEEKYPMPDWQHAANAKSRAKQQLNRGKLSRAEYDKIVAKANRLMAREKK